MLNKAALTAAGVGLLATLGLIGSASAEDYPSRTITLVSPYSAGGDADLAARNFAAAAQKALNQTMIVVDKTGASGVVGSAFVVGAAPDGYTLLLARTGSQSILPAIQPSKTRYTWDQYTFIGTLELNPYGCLVNADSPYHTFKELVAAIKTKGKAMNYGTAGVLTTNDMGPRLLFKILNLTDQKPTEIPYRGTGDTVQSLLAKQTDFSCGSLGSFISFVQAGKLRALIVTTPKRIKEMPDVPTARELGFEGMEGVVGWSGVFGPPGMPADVVKKLANAMQVVAKDPAWQAGTARTGSVPYVLSPEKTKEFAQKQYEVYRSLGESLGIIEKKP
ncbi:MAG TPA: tripartite tricarboxylate transporter substrate binding protein [Pseudolabrys sp.]|nr:tripartite tricarboxylate transporter substrate binding protein [Pseudolabrys sp.]